MWIEISGLLLKQYYPIIRMKEKKDSEEIAK